MSIRSQSSAELSNDQWCVCVCVCRGVAWDLRIPICWWGPWENLPSATTVKAFKNTVQRIREFLLRQSQTVAMLVHTRHTLQPDWTRGHRYFLLPSHTCKTLFCCFFVCKAHLSVCDTFYLCGSSGNLIKFARVIFHPKKCLDRWKDRRTDG